jgi:hypothetical protein
LHRLRDEEWPQRSERSAARRSRCAQEIGRYAGGAAVNESEKQAAKILDAMYARGMNAKEFAAELAAAEERGRRRGVEECVDVVMLVRTSQRLELAESLRLLLDPDWHGAVGDLPASDSSSVARAVPTTGHLAPRDSGKEG